MTDRLERIKDKWNIPPVLPMNVPWGKDDVAWLVSEVERLRAEAERADEEATTLANSDIATTEQVIRALRVENDRLRAALEKSMKINPYGSIENADARDTALRALGFDAVDPDTLGTLARDPRSREIRAGLTTHDDD